MKLTPFNHGDAETLHDIHKLVNSTVCYNLKSEMNNPAFLYYCKYHSEKYIQKDADIGHTVLLFDDDELVGTGTVIRSYIKRVFIHPEHQKKGLGTTIVQYLEEYAKQHGEKRTYLSCSLQAKSFFRKLGYEVKAKREMELPGEHCTLTYYEMEKRFQRDYYF
ncbi:MAG: GNAT family N-acetyltransferase [Spirochaetia bacterium]